MSFFDDLGGAAGQLVDTVDSLAETAGGIAGSLAKLKAAGQSLNAKPGTVGTPYVPPGFAVQGPPVAPADSSGLLLVGAGLVLLLVLAKS